MMKLHEPHGLNNPIFDGDTFRLELGNGRFLDIWESQDGGVIVEVANRALDDLVIKPTGPNGVEILNAPNKFN